MWKLLQNKLANLTLSVSDQVSSGTGKLFNLFKLAQLSSWLTRHLSKPPALLGIESFAAAALAVCYFFLMIPQGTTPRMFDNNETSISLFTYLSDCPYTQKNLVSTFSIWKTRLAGPMITGKVCDLVGGKTPGENIFQSPRVVFGGYAFTKLGVVFGCYHAAWLFLLFAVLILHRKDALLIIVGVFSGLMYNFIWPSGQWFFPWDLPVLFFFTWACLLYDQRQIIPLMVVVWLGSLFKETVLCCTLLLLLGEHWTLKKRIGGFVATTIACLLTRKLLMAVYDVKIVFLALHNVGDIHELAAKTWAMLTDNLHLLFSLNLNHVLFANAGALLIMLLIPWRNRREVVFKILALAFIIGQFLFAIIAEFRIWYEILPLGWMLISETISRRCPTVFEKPAAPLTQSQSAQVTRTDRLMKGSYWLTTGGLLVLALGALVVGKFSPPKQAKGNESDAAVLQVLTSMAQKGDAKAQNSLGGRYITGDGVSRNLEEALKWFRRAADQGNEQAQFNLGLIYLKGLGVKPDNVEAAIWFRRAAEKGVVEAQYSLGFLLFERKDYAEAAQWFLKAAQQGNVPGQISLGKMHRQGQGVKQDYVEAYKWLKLAQLQGAQDAETELKACSTSMTRDQIEAAEQLVKQLQK